jgi:hypothetical protein
MWCGLMGVLVSSKAHDFGFLYQGIIMTQFVMNSQGENTLQPLGHFWVQYLEYMLYNILEEVKF